MNVVRHYKGKYYQLLHVGQHTETGEKLAVYKQLYESEYPYGHVWIRPFSMFNEQIIYNNKVINRFEQVEDPFEIFNENIKSKEISLE